MEFDEIRPILGGLLGAAIAAGFVRLAARWVPTASACKPAAWLLDTYRWPIRAALGLFGAGMLSGIWMYAVGGFAQTDWRPVAFGFGGGCTAAAVALILGSLALRGSPRDAFIAFAIAQRTPLAVLAGILSIGAGALLAAVSTYVG